MFIFVVLACVVSGLGFATYREVRAAALMRATDALERLGAIQSMTSMGGAATAALLPTTGADPDWCRYCPFYLPASTDLAAACNGAVKKTATPAA